jgi:hypothetical protein
MAEVPHPANFEDRANKGERRCSVVVAPALGCARPAVQGSSLCAEHKAAQEATEATAEEQQQEQEQEQARLDLRARLSHPSPTTNLAARLRNTEGPPTDEQGSSTPTPGIRSPGQYTAPGLGRVLATQELLGLEPGDHVRHAKWGIGRISQIIGEGDKKVATIKFDRAGEKHLLLRWRQVRPYRPEAEQDVPEKIEEQEHDR